jgi:hypothetical protein
MIERKGWRKVRYWFLKEGWGSGRWTLLILGTLLVLGPQLWEKLVVLLLIKK